MIIAGDLNTEAVKWKPKQVSGLPDRRRCRLCRRLDFFASTGDPGLTWPLHGEDPFTPVSTPTQRIDLVLIRGPVAVMEQHGGHTLGDLIHQDCGLQTMRRLSVVNLKP